jgi:hypothetical protein
MLRVRTTKALISDVLGIVSIDVNACHANVMDCFMMLGMIDVHRLVEK